MTTVLFDIFFQVPSGTYIYMTFDDGPNEGTPYVLDALKEVFLEIVFQKDCTLFQVGVRATFFINSDNLHGDNPETVIPETSHYNM